MLAAFICARSCGMGGDERETYLTIKSKTAFLRLDHDLCT